VTPLRGIKAAFSFESKEGWKFWDVAGPGSAVTGPNTLTALALNHYNGATMGLWWITPDNSVCGRHWNGLGWQATHAVTRSAVDASGSIVAIKRRVENERTKYGLAWVQENKQIGTAELLEWDGDHPKAGAWRVQKMIQDPPVEEGTIASIVGIGNSYPWYILYPSARDYNVIISQVVQPSTAQYHQNHLRDVFNPKDKTYYYKGTEGLKPNFKKANLLDENKALLQDVYDQYETKSSSACAIAAALRFVARKTPHKSLTKDPSRLFLYYNARAVRLMNSSVDKHKGFPSAVTDSGASCRDVFM
jgi:hypothetical protein